MDHFKLHSKYKPTGDQPQAIEELVRGFREGNQFETLLGVTGSGKTFTMANVIEQLNRPTLIISHNKTLAAQLYGEMKEFFPENAVEYFVSYYDYYQPEAYVPQTDTYIAKDSAINEEIDKLRLSATAALVERRDVIVVASVSCIYGLGSPEDYLGMMVSLRPGMEKDRDEVIRALIDIQYTRNEMDFHRGTFRVRGDVLEIFPANYGDTAIRVEFFGDEIDRITEIDVLTGEIKCRLEHFAVFPASHYVVPQEKILRACDNIEAELEERVKYFKGEDKLLEAQRIAERNSEGHVIMYADTITDSMRVAIEETERRRKIQQEYNEAHGITPTTIQKSVRELISVSKKIAKEEMNFKKSPESMNKAELTKLIADIQKKMEKAAADLNFEAAAEYRDKMIELKGMLRDL